MTVVVRARPQRVARSPDVEPSRAVRAASEARYVGHAVCSAVRHSRVCFSGESGAGGTNAAQRWSRDGRSSRQPPASASRNGQPRGVACSATASAAGAGRSAGIGRGGSRGGSARGGSASAMFIAREHSQTNPPESTRSWRRPIFPKGCPLSIFGAGELDFRVRDGNGYGLSASVTRILLLDVIGCVRALVCLELVLEDERGRREVEINDLVRVVVGIRYPDFDQSSDPGSEAEVVKPSTISTAQLHPSPDFHMRPIKQVVYLRSYPV